MVSATTDALVFLSQEWAEAARQAVNDGPGPELRAKKIDKYWDWIAAARSRVDAVWGLAATDREGPNCLLITLSAGEAVAAQVVPIEEGRRRATYLQAGTTEGWRDMMNGYDVGKSVMYRKLMLDTGDVLMFFRAGYFWTESLAAIQQIPTTF